MVPPKLSISDYVGKVKGRTAIRILNKHRGLKKKPYWGNHFWAKGYCVDTVGLDADKIRKYVRYQEAQERKAEQLSLFTVKILGARKLTSSDLPPHIVGVYQSTTIRLSTVDQAVTISTSGQWPYFFKA